MLWTKNLHATKENVCLERKQQHVESITPNAQLILELRSTLSWLWGVYNSASLPTKCVSMGLCFTSSPRARGEMLPCKPLALRWHYKLTLNQLLLPVSSSSPSSLYWLFSPRKMGVPAAGWCQPLPPLCCARRQGSRIRWLQLKLSRSAEPICGTDLNTNNLLIFKARPTGI